MRRTLSLVLLSGALANAAAQELKPAPADRVQGRRLTDPTAGFSVEAPEGWTWSVAEDTNGKTYVCRAEHSTLLFMVMALDPKPGEKTSVDAMVEKALRQFEAAGLKVEGLTKKPSDRPVPGSSRISATVLGPEDFRRHLRAHIGIAEHVYSIQAAMERAEDEGLFDQFVSSFKPAGSRKAAPGSLK